MSKLVLTVIFTIILGAFVSFVGLDDVGEWYDKLVFIIAIALLWIGLICSLYWDKGDKLIDTIVDIIWIFGKK